MTWQNAFVLGACTVDVEGFRGSIFNGQLGPGESSPTFQDRLGNELTVSVSASGQVSLQSVNGQYDSSFRYTLRVIPSFPLGSQGIRVSGIQVINDGLQRNPAALADFQSNDGVNLIPSGSGWTPDPADLSALASRVELSIFGGQGAI